MSYDIQSVINWFLSKEEMTPKKLQRMLYYAYSWVLTLTNENKNDLHNKLFEEKFEAWVHGPVVPKVYYQYKNYGYHPINRVEKADGTFPPDIEDILNQVYEVYGSYSGIELDSISRQEEPWVEARGNTNPIEICSNELSDEIIFSFYIDKQ